MTRDQALAIDVAVLVDEQIAVARHMLNSAVELLRQGRLDAAAERAKWSAQALSNASRYHKLANRIHRVGDA